MAAAVINTPLMRNLELRDYRYKPLCNPHDSIFPDTMWAAW